MLDINALRNDPGGVAAALAKRGVALDTARFETLENERKRIQTRTQQLQAKRNALSKQVGIAKGRGEDASPLLAEVAGLGDEQKELERELDSVQAKLRDFLLELPNVTLYYYLFLALVIASVIICDRLERSRIGRAWMAIREDEIAAKAMGINTRNMKLLAFGMGATFGGVAGSMFAAFQGFVSPESFSLQESIMIVAMVVLGGIGHIPGVILGALLLAALPEVLRYVAGPLQQMTDGRLDAAILRQMLVALAMITVMLLRPRGLWPTPEHGKALQPTGG